MKVNDYYQNEFRREKRARCRDVGVVENNGHLVTQTRNALVIVTCASAPEETSTPRLVEKANPVILF